MEAVTEGAPMLRNIIWDVDGTLFDTYPAIVRAFSAAVRDLGANAPEGWIRELALVSLDHCVSALADACGLSSDAIESAFTTRYAERAIADSPPFPGVVDVCRYVCSIGGRNVIVTHRRRSGTMALLAASDMTALFAGVVAGDDGYPRKPDPASFEAALARWQLARSETIAVGDRTIDVAAARAAGLLSCRFTSDATDPDPDEPAADLELTAFGDLRRYLERANAEAPRAPTAAGRSASLAGDGR